MSIASVSVEGVLSRIAPYAMPAMQRDTTNIIMIRVISAFIIANLLHCW